MGGRERQVQEERILSARLPPEVFDGPVAQGRQDLPVLEAETILQELRAVLLDVDPDLEASPDVDELDGGVDDRSGE